MHKTTVNYVRLDGTLPRKRLVPFRYIKDSRDFFELSLQCFLFMNKKLIEYKRLFNENKNKAFPCVIKSGSEAK